MKMIKKLGRRTNAGGFTLVEAMVGMAVVGITFISLYSGLTYGFKRIHFSRENQRATQILVEKMETIRLYTWSQINQKDFIPNKFTASYYPEGGTTNAGVVYSGKIKIEDPKDLVTDYKDAMKLVTVELEWKTGNTPRARTISTYVSEFGLHNHVY